MLKIELSNKPICNNLIIVLIVIILYVAIQKIRLFITKYSYKKINNNPLSKIYNDHNYYRNIHWASNLEIDPNLEIDAQNKANKCVFAHDFNELKEKKEGENLYMIRTGVSLDQQRNQAINKATDAWYDEINWYNYFWPRFRKATGHFTQIVWKDTKRIGCAYNHCNGMNLVVCRYKEPGNVQGQFFNKVSLPISKIPGFINYGSVIGILIILSLLIIVYVGYIKYIKKTSINYDILYNNDLIDGIKNILTKCFNLKR